jgi:NAD+ kinase
MKLGLIVSDTPQAEEAAAELRARRDFVEPAEADVIVALGGDGFLLGQLHRMLNSGRKTPIFGMNRGTVGFLLNEFDSTDLDARLAAARPVPLVPLSMEAESWTGALIRSPAFNEVSLLRETRQAAKIEIAIDGKVRLDELACDGVLVSTPAGSTAYNLSANGPILPLGCDLLALTAISPFRPRRWRGALLPAASRIEFRILEARKRPVSAVADQLEVRDVARVTIRSDPASTLELLFDPDHALDDRILAEQFLS